jgi:hypothetical protein
MSASILTIFIGGPRLTREILKAILRPDGFLFMADCQRFGDARKRFGHSLRPCLAVVIDPPRPSDAHLAEQVLDEALRMREALRGVRIVALSAVQNRGIAEAAYPGLFDGSVDLDGAASTLVDHLRRIASGETLFVAGPAGTTEIETFGERPVTNPKVSKPCSRSFHTPPSS